MESKICYGCKLNKELADFYNLHSSKDKRTPLCKTCGKLKSTLAGKKRREDKGNSRVFNEGERWSKIDGYSRYEISDWGNIYSKKLQQLLKPSKSKKGYLVVKIYTDSGVKVGSQVHRLVAQCFIPNVDNKPQVHHKNYDKKCNYFWNLEWVTCKENIDDAIEAGARTARSNLKSNAMFSDKDIIDIREKFKEGLKNQEIANKYNCNHSTISKIRTGVHYPSV